MMEEALDWRGHKLPPGALLVIKDCVAAKGGFLLMYFLKKLLGSANSNESYGRQPPSTTRVVFVALTEPFSHFNRIAKKQGCNLIPHRDSGQLVFLDMIAASIQLMVPSPSSTQQVSETGHRTSATSAADLHAPQTGADTRPPNGQPTVQTPLHRLYQRVSETVRKNPTQIADERTVILIDDASLLEVLAGGRQIEVLSFLHYCRALSSGKHRCSVVVLVHGDTDVGMNAATGTKGGCTDHRRPQEERSGELMASLAQELDHIADVVISVDPLSTGLAADVHGQVTVVHYTDTLSNLELRKGVQTLQFKLMENNTLFFHPGGRF